MSEQKKYEFVPGDEIVIVPGLTLKRIRSLIAITAISVAPGDLGGYVENEANLDASGNAWVSGNAQVYGNAQVSGNARVYGDAQVSGNALVYGNALVSGNALVYGNARVYGNAQVSGNARVYGDAQVSGDAQIKSCTDWLLLGPAKSSGRFTTAYLDSKIGVRVSCGCFSGGVQDFSFQIEETHAGNLPHLQQYRLFCQLIAFNFGVEPACT